jgi:hypothetical protein
MGTYGRQIYAARQAKELLRGLRHLAVSRTHVAPDRSAHSAARHRFLAHVADHAHLPEPTAASIKLEARNTFGFRNRTNQRLRSRCATTWRSRREAHPHHIRRPEHAAAILQLATWEDISLGGWIQTSSPGLFTLPTNAAIVDAIFSSERTFVSSSTESRAEELPSIAMQRYGSRVIRSLLATATAGAPE